ncbi:glycosyltransferase [Aeromonas veronii]|uniref:capsular polysaccharide export protein, LipB/KpsS family n=1 Tax=Aeromonas veronii TaxID=654 RepID=UPI001244997F|nr:glycosyltransferase [Aeromonas veronii]KAB0670658.1 glycosyltransferase [Aeromonas veronii]
MFKIENYDTAINFESELTVIITLRSVEHYDMVSRLAYRKFDLDIPDSVSFLVVDDGSSSIESSKIRAQCNELGFSYIKIHSGDYKFSPGRARNIGAQYAKTKYIMHEDVDLIPYVGFYRQILNEIKLNALDYNMGLFLSIPVAYLNCQATEEYMSLPVEERNNIFFHRLMVGCDNTFDFFMPASSVIVVSRHYYLSIGGYNEQFVDWGLEDLEYAYRLTRSSNRFHTPSRYKDLISKPVFSQQFEYRGWRNQFRLHGELCFRKGIILFHAWHPVDKKWRSAKGHNKNMKMFNMSVDKFERNGHTLPYLPCAYKGKTLIFGKGCFVFNRLLLPELGAVDIKGYEYFLHDTCIIDYIEKNEINRVVFTNPYANESRLYIYNKIKNKKIPFYVVERGALRDSIYIDPTGFCSESRMYRKEHWDKTLLPNEIKRTLEYIEGEKNIDVSLEKQAVRIGYRQLRSDLNIPESKRVLFVPLQSRSDTTTNYFSGEIGTFDNFISLVNSVANSIDNNWVVIVKKHPLSTVEEEISNVVFSDANIKDLIEISDYVLLMNSGVGVLSLLWNKPVIYTAQAFYADDDLNVQAKNTNDVLRIIKSNFQPNKDKVIRFLSYLINDFYSFGSMGVYEKKHTENANLTITTALDYYRVNVDGVNIYDDNPLSNKVPFTSPLYDPFRQDLSQSKNVQVNKKEPPLQHGNKVVVRGERASYRKVRKLFKTPKLFFVDAIRNMRH